MLDNEVRKSNLIVLGTQWGDEGKAKIIDLLAGHFDIIGRYQGGGNAGHTVIIDGEKIIFHLVPTGILHPQKKVLLGNGMVVHYPTLIKEMDKLLARGLILRDRLVVSKRAHLILPSHMAIEQVIEESMNKGKIGTTMRGIGPAYEDKIARRGIIVADTLDPDRFREKIEENSKLKRMIAERLFNQKIMSTDAIVDEYQPLIERIKPFVKDSSRWLHTLLSQGESILCEGAQGTHLDIDHGTYPYVTSSNATAGGVLTGMGVGPHWFHHVLGICKAYITRVGGGPFPTEDFGQDGDYIRDCGHEFGSTTGRPRRCGWFDAPLMRYTSRINGLTALAVTKLDVLTGFDKIKICHRYKLDDNYLTEFPEDPGCISELKPDYIKVDGWQEDITQCKKYNDLPSKAQHFLKTLEEMTGLEIAIVSVGPERHQSIIVKNARFFNDFPSIITDRNNYDD